MKIIRRIFFVLFTLLLLAGCQSQPDQPPAPTAIPLSNPQTGILDPTVKVIPLENPINLPQGFGITVYASGLTDPRMMAFGPDGNLYLTEPSTGQVIRIIDEDRDGVGDRVETAADGFIQPSGIAFYQDGSLYVAETTRVFQLTDPDGDGYFQDKKIITAGIAAGGNTNRSLIFSPDWGHFYLAIGSSCNVCLEQDERRATVMRFKADGTEGKIFTRGLRNVIGMDFRPETDYLWVVNMEREGLGGNLPPDTLYVIYINANAGWPYCHAGRIIDPEYGSKDSCSENLLKPIVELESQSEPYGMTFYTGDQFPEEFDKDVFIALHGSGTGSTARGYKIVRIPRGAGIEPRVEDFATGWIGEDGSPWGTPTDLIQGPDGSLFLSDEEGGLVYRIFYTGK